MTQASDSASEGLDGAEQRLQRWGFELSTEDVAPTIRTALEILRRSDLPAPPRAVEVAVELTAIAAAMRVRFDEPELTPDEIDMFIRGLRHYMNSWWHE